MTTFVAFKPPPDGPFTFLAALDGTTYQIQVTWNVFGERWYLNLYDTSANLVVCKAITPSPLGYDLPLLAGYFDTLFLFRDETSQFEIGGVLDQSGVVFAPMPQMLPFLLDSAGNVLLDAEGNPLLGADL